MTYQILVATGCYVGRHVWDFTSNSTELDAEPLPCHRCKCGRYTYAEARTIRETDGQRATTPPPDAGTEGA
jgi:hypothetical protein